MGERSATIDRDAPSIPLADPELRVGGSPSLRLMLGPSTPSELQR
jgi:hypothetical protein